MVRPAAPLRGAAVGVAAVAGPHAVLPPVAAPAELTVPLCVRRANGRIL